MHLFIVDSEKNIHLKMAHYFEEEIATGMFNFHFATSAEKIMPLLMNCKIDVILLDIGISKGLEMAKVVKSHFPHLLLLITTACPDENSYRVALACEADDFMTKPMHLGILRQKFLNYLICSVKNGC